VDARGVVVAFVVVVVVAFVVVAFAGVAFAGVAFVVVAFVVVAFAVVAFVVVAFVVVAFVVVPFAVVADGRAALPPASGWAPPAVSGFCTGDAAPTDAGAAAFAADAATGFTFVVAVVVVADAPGEAERGTPASDGAGANGRERRRMLGGSSGARAGADDAWAGNARLHSAHDEAPAGFLAPQAGQNIDDDVVRRQGSLKRVEQRPSGPDRR
jgi:hypothetical protein